MPPERREQPESTRARAEPPPMPPPGDAQDHAGGECQRQLLPPYGGPGDMLLPDGRTLQVLEQAIRDSADEGAADEGCKWPGQLIGDRHRADVAFVMARLGGGPCRLWFCLHVPIAGQRACRPTRLSVRTCPYQRLNVRCGRATFVWSGGVLMTVLGLRQPRRVAAAAPSVSPRRRTAPMPPAWTRRAPARCGSS